MNALQLLSALNWVFALLYGAPLVVLLALGAPVEVLAVALLVCLFVAAPHVYLALVIDKGRGRGLQTVLAALSLLAFPVGTVFGVFALMTIWSERYGPLFEAGGAAVDEPGAAGAARDFSATADGLEHEVAESPRAFALRLRRAGAPNAQVRARLEELGLDREAVAMVMRSLAPTGSASGRGGR